MDLRPNRPAISHLGPHARNLRHKKLARPNAREGRAARSEANRTAPEDEVIYHGLVKPCEANQYADLCRLYRKEAASIEHQGGKPLLVVLDFELKRILDRERVAARQEEDNPEELDRLAEKHGFTVVDREIRRRVSDVPRRSDIAGRGVARGE